MKLGKRKALWTLTAILIVAAAWWMSGRGVARPNILFVTLDTTRADRLGCYGYAHAATPTLDKLAGEGVVFDRAYAPAPLTLPSHTSMFTGLNPPEHGLNSNGRGRLEQSIPTLAEILAAEGYATGAFVASFVLNKKFGLNRGFQHYDDDLTGANLEDDPHHWQRDGQVVVDRALAWIQQKRNGPMFCWVHLYDPHFPYVLHEREFGETFRGRPYDAEIAYVDRQIKRLTDLLSADGRFQGTLVVVVGDHGEGLGEHVERTHGYTLYESTQHVPLIIAGAGLAVSGVRVATPVSLVDITPTLLDALGLKHSMQSGRTLKPALAGRQLAPHDCYAETNDPFFANGWSPLQSLTGEKWKYIRTTLPELYDLKNDPHETRNLAAAHPAEVDRLEQALSAMERGMQHASAGQVSLSRKEALALKSLGYAGSHADPKLSPEARLPDVKQMLPYDVAVDDALALQRLGNTAEALDKLREVSSAAPNHLAAHIYLGEALVAQGDLAGGRTEFERALAIKPDSSVAHSHLGNLFVQQKQFAKAVDEFRAAIESDPDGLDAHYNLGLALGHLGRLTDAENEFHTAISLGPQYVPAYVALGNLQNQRGFASLAIDSYQHAVELNPRLSAARINLGVMLAGQKRYDESLAHLSEAVRLAPESFEAQFNLGLLYAARRQFKQAQQHLSEATRLRPAHAEARAQLQRAQDALASDR